MTDCSCLFPIQYSSEWPITLPTVCQGGVLAHHVRGHDHGVDAELDEPRDELGEGRDRGSPARAKV